VFGILFLRLIFIRVSLKSWKEPRSRASGAWEKADCLCHTIQELLLAFSDALGEVCDCLFHFLASAKRVCLGRNEGDLEGFEGEVLNSRNFQMLAFNFLRIFQGIVFWYIYEWIY